MASAILTPVIRLEPKLNRVRGHLRVLAGAERVRIPGLTYHKRSRLARAAGRFIRGCIDVQFLVRIDRYKDGDFVKGIQIASEIPLEFLPIDGLPLSLRYQCSRVPVLPGNLFISSCARAPVFVSHRSIKDILVIRSFSEEDILKNLLVSSIDVARKNSAFDWNIKVVDVGCENDIVDALSGFHGAILIFDCHGTFEGTSGVGTIVVGGVPVDVWGLRDRLSLPPIVMFSACDTHPIDGGHGSCANAAFVLGARTVLATMLPIDGRTASMFTARLILRVYDYIAAALKSRTMLSWREVVSGMIYMSYATEVMRILQHYSIVSLTDDELGAVQMVVNNAVSKRNPNWLEEFISALARIGGVDQDWVKEKIEKFAFITDSLKYVQLGSPENIIILGDKDYDQLPFSSPR